MSHLADSWRISPNDTLTDKKSKEQVSYDQNAFSEIDTQKRVTSNIPLPGKITIVNTKSAESSTSYNENAESSVSNKIIFVLIHNNSSVMKEGAVVKSDVTVAEKRRTT